MIPLADVRAWRCRAGGPRASRRTRSRARHGGEIHWSGILQNLTVSAAAIAGGLWTLYRFIAERQAHSVLSIEVQHSEHSLTGTLYSSMWP